MSIIDGFVKVWPYLSRYKTRIFTSFVFAGIVGLFWGANLSVVFPVTTVLMEGNLQDYVDDQLNEIQANTDQTQSRVAEIDQELSSETITDTQRIRLLETRSEYQERIARASRSIHWLNWSKANVLPWLPTDQFNTVALLFGLLVLATAFKGVFIFLQNVLVGSIVELTTIDLRKACFRKCLTLDYQSLMMEGTPTLMSRFTFDLQELSRGLTLVGGRLAREPIKGLSCIVLAFLVNWRLTLLSLIFAPIGAYMFYRFGKMLKQASHRMMDSMARIYQVLEETLNAMKVVIAFGNARKHRQQFHRENRAYYRKAMKIHIINAITNPSVELLGMGAIFLTVLPCMYLLLRQSTSIWGVQFADEPLDIPTLILIYTLLVGAVDPVRKLSSVFSTVKRSVAAADRIMKFLESEPRIHEAQSPRLLPRHSEKIEFRNIRFAYASKDGSRRPDALSNVSVNIDFGECVIVVGENGSGKSTLINLIPRYYDPDQGQVLIDDINIQDVSTKELRSQMGVVTQDTFLFNTSIYENIRYGSPYATQDQIEKAAEKAGVTQFINQLPDGFESLVGDKGTSLSGGQRQRISLARAIVRNPSILILDEATSAIDSQSELQIQQALKSFENKCTIFIITHAVNRTILDIATRILVMHEGHLIAHGKHDQLLETCPIYHNLFQAQMKQRAA